MKPSWATSVLLAATLLSACGGAAAPAPSGAAPGTSAAASKPAAASAPAASASAKPAASAAATAPASIAGGAEWDALVAAAKREGKVTCACPPIPPIRELITREWNAAFQGIELDYAPATLPQFTSKVTAERAAGQYLQDIYFWGMALEVYQLGDTGAFDPIVPTLVLPEVKDEKVWGGWDKAFMDSAKKTVLGFYRVKTNDTKYNAGVLGDGAIKTHSDLTDPKLKGKIVWWDPRIGGGGITAATVVYAELGEDKLKTIMVDQQPLFIQNGSNDIVERMVRGGYLVGVGAGDLTAPLKPYLDAGVKIDIKDAELPGLPFESSGYGSVVLFNKAAHPNGAKVFLNWLLTKDLQAKLSKATSYNSRRGDVPPVVPANVPPPGPNYTDSQGQDFILKYQQTVTRLVKEWRPQ